MTVSRFLMQEREWPGYGDKQKALQKLAEAGFTDLDVKVVPGDILNNCYIIVWPENLASHPSYLQR
jgi:hypothetical protein